MNKSIQMIGIAAIALSAGNAKATLVYSPGEVRDTQSNLSWKYFESFTAGESSGYSPATVGQTSELFLHYAPPDSGGVLPGYAPTYGGVVDYTTSGDGMMFSISWEGTYYDPKPYVPPSLIDSFGYTISYGGGGPSTDYVSKLTPFVADDVGWLPVLVQSTFAANQYGNIWGNEKGIINPGVADAIGAAGYLMVNSIPEPPISALLLLGIGGLGLLARHRARG